jgi:SAM-dependent methyltransferase
MRPFGVLIASGDDVTDLLEQASQDRIWDFFQNDLSHTFIGSRSRLAHLANKVRGVGPVLNIGVGGGQFEMEAIARQIDVYSLDPSERSIEALRQHLGLGEKAKVGYGQSIPFPAGFFGAVVISEVLEHLTAAEAAAVVADAARVLKPGGILVGTVPARERLEDQQVMCPHCRTSFHRWGHQQSFGQEGILRLTSPYLHAISVYMRPFPAWPQLNWKGKLHSAAHLVLCQFGVHGRNENIVFVCGKD